VNKPELIIRATRRARQYRHFRTVAEIVGGVILLSGGAAGAASLAVPATTGTTIHACASTKTGALSVLLKSGAKCPKGTKPLSWNKTGPQGPAGTTVLFGTNTNKAATGSGGAQCSLGEIILTAGKTAALGTLPADGQTLPISSNTALFSLLGTEYGGNGTTTFAVPNLKKSAPSGLSYSICATTGIFP
jgi:Phage Tail Collar Domain